ncbi:MAG: histidine phosphatase family protein [Rikenellaceae bacterium]
MAAIYLQRHTQPALDLKLCYGVSDVALRDEFESEDLPQIIDRVRGLNPRVIYSSPLQRCDKLAQRIAKELNLGEVKIDPRTVELNFGDWELMPWSEIYERAEGRAWFDDYLNIPAPGGESFVEMVGRAKSFLEDIIDAQDDIMVVTHGGFIRAMMVASGEVQLQDAFDAKVEYGDTVALEI